MRIHEIGAPKGARKTPKRVGRGDGSGRGNYSGKGQKGQKARTGGGVRPGFEGGQTPIIRRLPSIRGFNNIFKQEYVIVNLSSFDSLPENAEVTPEALLKAKIVRNLKHPVKILGEGTITKSLTVEAHRFSKSAREKIEAAGGRVRMIE
ncbi:MAG: 50S ribosomal protein L15 [Chloroflexi bacterium]|nr:50S ribosomal protein L15 [Chloroflexota bacterium]